MELTDFQALSQKKTTSTMQVNQPTLVGSIGAAPTGWYFKTKVRIGFSFFKRYATNFICLFAADVTALVLSFELAALSRYMLKGEAMNPAWVLWLVPLWGLGALFSKILPGWGMSSVECLRRQVCLTFWVFSAAATMLFLTQSGVANSRFTYLGAFVLAIPAIPLSRWYMRGLLIRLGLWGLPVAIYGGGVASRKIIRSLLNEPGIGYRPHCVFDDDPTLMGTEVEGIPVRGTTEEIVRSVPVAIVAMTRIDGERLCEMMQGALSSYLRVMIIPNLVHLPSIWADSRDLGGIPSLEIKNNLLDPSKRVFKRSFELALTWGTLPFWGPLYLAICAAIWLEDREDPIFRQKRIGQGGTSFDTLKFRTMVPDAERVLEEALSKDPALREEWERDCKLRKDPRITRVGQFLRKTSLDEIPQLINVLRGQMSLVGPRPLPGYHYKKLPADVQKLRERVKPGMTGLWQVSGRSDAGDEGMVRFDPYYVRNWSVWLDLVILFRTVRVVLLGSGAR